ncbi:MAG: alpha-L-fucosidase [Erythrobacter sp.]|uniref:alpha-amylase family protein n=1 Tax=Erythrobacter sp. TaxID=1042 RepID=UPI002607FA77|nr:alpha-amylase family protein [Erythrobacter sp.]MDJ0978138.1 alpha-L-fucosidase [Erythrobacter sp.]
MSLPYRQIHLDFHTSEKIPEIGADFNGADFARTLKDAHVDSVVLFAKCHHGWSYYDSEVGQRHPQLDFDLLQAQSEACSAEGIRTPIYLSVGWDEQAAFANPGWRRILPDGTFHMAMGKNLDPMWSYLCLNTPYLDYVLAQIEEIATRFPNADGLWLDIVFQHECCCNYCRKGMDEAGLDWTSETDRQSFAHDVLQNYLKKSAETIRRINPDMSIFHNSSMVPRGDRRVFDDFSHVEIEAVPTGGWGYDHFPISARYVDPFGEPYMGVTVRFDIIWGELGGYKHPKALAGEIATMQAHGARACIGDQLDPRGVLDPSAYAMIGQVFAEAKAREALIEGTTNVAEVGLLSSIAVRDPGSLSRDARHIDEDYGALRILQQSGFLFDVIDCDTRFEDYPLLVLPDKVRIDDALANRLQVYLDQGGAVLLTGESGLKPDSSGFALDIGAQFAGPSPFENCHIIPEPDLRPDFIDDPFLIMCPTLRIVPTDGETLGKVYDPQFNRSPRQFSGHINTPREREPSSFSCGVRKGKLAYLPIPVFSLYKQLGQAMVRDFTARVIESLLPDGRRLTTNLPSSATTTVREGDGRLVLQHVYAPRELRGQTQLGNIEAIDALPSLADVMFQFREDRPVKDVRLGETSLDFQQRDGVVSFTAERLPGTAQIVIAL